MLRDRAFEMFWKNEGSNNVYEVEKNVAAMLEQFLRVAHISPDEANNLDHKLGLKTRMPDGWNFETGSVMARLVAAGIVIEIKDWPT
jgi:hypothetical protein